jgi:hypothetical protein
MVMSAEGIRTSPICVAPKPPILASGSGTATSTAMITPTKSSVAAHNHT